MKTGNSFSEGLVFNSAALQISTSWLPFEWECTLIYSWNVMQGNASLVCMKFESSLHGPVQMHVRPKNEWKSMLRSNGSELDMHKGLHKLAHQVIMWNAKMNINIKLFETHSWKVQKINVSNGWKALEIRIKSHNGQKFIWKLEIYENWLWRFGYKTCVGSLWKFSSKASIFKPLFFNDSSLK